MHFKCKECNKLSKAEAWDETTRMLFGSNTVSIMEAYVNEELEDFFFLCPRCLTKDAEPEAVIGELKCNLQDALNCSKPEAV